MILSDILGPSLKNSFSMDAGIECPLSQTLHTEDSCRLAGLILGLNLFRSGNFPSYPHGCFWSDNQPGKASFNTANAGIPTQDVPKTWDDTQGGICGWTQGSQNLIANKISR